MPVALPPAHVLRAIYEDVISIGAMATARKHGLPPSTVENRFRAAMRTLNLPDKRPRGQANTGEAQSTAEVSWPVENGVFLVFGDTHWTHPAQERSVAHEALLRAVPRIKPDFLLCAGDALDFGEISRHDPVGWQPHVKVKDTIAAGRLHLGELAELAPKARRFWCIGNHDERHDNYLARHAAAFEDEPGMRLADKFSDWRQAWRFDFSAFYALHRWHNGEHAAYNNAMKSGSSVVTGDTHKLRVTARENLKGRVYGVETGMLADPNWDCFGYLRGKPTA
ncbi:MPP_superfamily domain containing protein, partial [uncultured Caudovirales phage]